MWLLDDELAELVAYSRLHVLVGHHLELIQHAVALLTVATVGNGR